MKHDLGRLLGKPASIEPALGRHLDRHLSEVAEVAATHVVEFTEVVLHGAAFPTGLTAFAEECHQLPSDP